MGESWLTCYLDFKYWRGYVLVYESYNSSSDDACSYYVDDWDCKIMTVSTTKVTPLLQIQRAQTVPAVKDITIHTLYRSAYVSYMTE